MREPVAEEVGPLNATLQRRALVAVTQHRQHAGELVVHRLAERYALRCAGRPAGPHVLSGPFRIDEAERQDTHPMLCRELDRLVA